MRSSGIGGQAVMEGVMMRNGHLYAVAIRKPDNEIEVMTDQYSPLTERHKLFSLPFIRGIFAFVDSLKLGLGIMSYSASFYEDEEPLDEDPEKAKKKEDMLMGITMAAAVVLAVVIFMLLPMFLANLLRRFISSSILMGLIEGLLRLAIFLGYVAAISLMEDIRRVYMYHGAEHKCINCIEHGLDLTVENVRASSRQHKRCGTSFLLFVVFVSIVFSMIIQTDVLWMRMLLRILMIPVIAGISYEILRLAGNSDNPVINALSKPGLMLQRLTTREPDDSMIEVGIKSVEAVFDWKQYEAETFGRKFD